jgi:hypothetical protein
MRREAPDRSPLWHASMSPILYSSFSRTFCKFALGHETILQISTGHSHCVARKVHKVADVLPACVYYGHYLVRYTPKTSAAYCVPRKVVVNFP